MRAYRKLDTPSLYCIIQINEKGFKYTTVRISNFLCVM